MSEAAPADAVGRVRREAYMLIIGDRRTDAFRPSDHAANLALRVWIVAAVAALDPPVTSEERQAAAKLGRELGPLPVTVIRDVITSETTVIDNNRLIDADFS
jgi:hypothetical protein